MSKTDTDVTSTASVMKISKKMRVCLLNLAAQDESDEPTSIILENRITEEVLSRLPTILINFST